MLEDEDGDRPVLAILVPFQPSGVSRATERAAQVIGYRAPGILPLVGIEAVGNQIAWLYEAVDGVAATRIADSPDFGPRASAELVLAVARVVMATPHPGPEPEDVLLTPEGVRVANFEGPLPRDPGFRAPLSTDPMTDAARVYRIGALFAAVLGAPLSPASERRAHEAAVRRAIIRAMSRPGAVFGKAFGEWMRATLAWEPEARPPLSRVLPTLEDLVESTAGPSLDVLVRARLNHWITESFGEDDEEATTLPLDWETVQDVIHPMPTVEAGRRTLQDETILGDLNIEDDPTVDSEMSPRKEPTPPSVIERGSIPVGVGPPPELAARQPRLPSGFLEDQTVPFEEPTQLERPPAPPVPPPSHSLQVVAGVLLVIAVGLCIAWALFL